MSGSPIYLDGRLAGAYSYSLSAFEVEPVAGVTPIDLDAHRDAAARSRPGFWPLEGAAPLPGAARAEPRRRARARTRRSTTFDGAPGSLRPRGARAPARRAPRLRARRRRAAMVPAATPLMMAGVGDQAARGPSQARRAARPRAAPGRRRRATTIRTRRRTSSTAAASACSSRAATCRSWVSARRPTSTARARSPASATRCSTAATRRSPTCIGRVLWINASAQASHKVGECARPLGTLVQDRQTAIIVDEHIDGARHPGRRRHRRASSARRSTHWHAEVDGRQVHGARASRRRCSSRSSRRRRASGAT